MTLLFSEAGHAALRGFLMKPALCLFDFDGTLAPLINNPALVSLPHGIQQQLQALQTRAPVGIITGRSLEDMRKRLKFDPDYVIGNHGLEGLPGWQRHAHKNFELCRSWLASLQSVLSDVGDAGWIEDKLSRPCRPALKNYRRRRESLPVNSMPAYYLPALATKVGP